MNERILDDITLYATPEEILAGATAEPPSSVSVAVSSAVSAAVVSTTVDNTIDHGC